MVGLLVITLWAASAHAAPARGSHRSNGRSAPGLASAAPSAQAKAATLSQITGLSPSQLTSTSECAAAAPGHATCDSQAIILRSTRRLVHPRVRHRASFTQVFPRIARGIAPDVTPAAAPPNAGTPAYLQQAYDLAYLSQTAGSSDTVAIVDAYDDPNAEADLGVYRSTFGLPACTTANGCFQKVNQNGTSSPMPSGNSWEDEISLDLDAVSALCPNCHILLVEANSNADSDLDQAVITAAGMGAQQISNSWSGGAIGPIGGTYTFPGVATIAATGDYGLDGPGWDAYPAALPGVTAAGGTTLAPSSTAGRTLRGWNESAWSGAGSGCDMAESKPAYQTDTGCTGRSYADVSADANPNTGLVIYDSDLGGWMGFGGTSLATPLIAAFDALTGNGASGPQWAYSDAALLNDPVTGSNGTCAAALSYICNAGAGYDGPTGAGSISGDVVSGAPGIGGPGFGSGSTYSYVENFSDTTATLSGGVYPNGVDTTYWWQYGPTSAYGQQTAAVDIGSGRPPASVTDSLSGLAASTTYHYRLVAQNSLGTSYGYDYTFTTAPSGGAAPAATVAPAISGTPTEGTTLHFASTWNPAGTTWSYQWARSTDGGTTWLPIAGASGTTYTLGGADLNAKIEVTVTSTNTYGSTGSTSAPIGPVTSGAPVVTSPPVISGSATQGTSLHFASAWNPSGTSWAYQWSRSTDGGTTWSNISGATGTTYTLGAADQGAKIEVTVTATNTYGSASSTSTPFGPVGAAAPAVTSPPVISGAAAEGTTLHFASTWSPGGTSWAYQWSRSTDGGTTWSAISGATGTTYTLASADLNAKIEVTVTSTNSYGSASSTSAAIGPVTSGAPVVTSPPVISGAATEGTTLHFASTWSVAGTSWAYQWSRSTNGGTTWAPISGATGTTYTLGAADLGAKIEVTVTSANTYGSTSSTSAAVGPVAS